MLGLFLTTTRASVRNTQKKLRNDNESGCVRLSDDS